MKIKKQAKLKERTFFVREEGGQCDTRPDRTRAEDEAPVPYRGDLRLRQ